VEILASKKKLPQLKQSRDADPDLQSKFAFDLRFHPICYKSTEKRSPRLNRINLIT
jgi:hypothetical protein